MSVGGCLFLALTSIRSQVDSLSVHTWYLHMPASDHMWSDITSLLCVQINKCIAGTRGTLYRQTKKWNNVEHLPKLTQKLTKVFNCLKESGDFFHRLQNSRQYCLLFTVVVKFDMFTSHKIVMSGLTSCKMQNIKQLSFFHLFASRFVSICHELSKRWK